MSIKVWLKLVGVISLVASMAAGAQNSMPNRAQALKALE